MSKSVARNESARSPARWEDRLLTGAVFDRHIGSAIDDDRVLTTLPAHAPGFTQLPDNVGLNMCSVDSTTTCPSTTWCQSTTACPSTTNCKSIQTCIEPGAISANTRIWPPSVS